MRDAKPILTLLMLTGLGLFLLALWWVSESTPNRQRHLTQIAVGEQAQSGPPTGLEAQATWLIGHRLPRLAGLTLPLAAAALLGIGEGLARRVHDPYRGVQVRNWTIGLMSCALTPGIIGALLLLPIPWPIPTVAILLSLWNVLTFYLLTHGRPHVP